MRWHAYRFNPHQGEIEYLGLLGEFATKSGAERAAEQLWPDFMGEYIGMAMDVHSVSVEPETSPYLQQILESRALTAATH